MENKKSYSKGQLIGLILGIVAFTVIYWFLPIETLSQEGKAVLATLVLISTWWVSEALNTGITGLVPLVLFPLTGALAAGPTAAAYGNNTIFMFFGGFAIALALERWGLHNRIALNIIKIVGTSLNKLIVGLLISATFISMWVSNTATILMLLPIANAIGSKMSELMLQENKNNKNDAKNFKKAVVFATGFGAIIGGSMTLIGTPTNIALASFSKELAGFEVPFAKFMLWEFPIALVQIITAIILINNIFYKTNLKELKAGKDYINSELKILGKMSAEEKIVSAIFFITVFMWVSMNFIWKSIVPGISDVIISVSAAILLFMIPNTKGSRILDGDSVKKMPWSVILMLMGGMAIAKGFTETDLAQWMGNQVLLFKDSSPLVIISIVALIGIIVTQFAPNTATGAIIIPIAASVGQAAGIDQFTVMTAAALSVGFSSTFPSGTPLMGIIYGQGNFEMKEMVRVGIGFAIVSFLAVVINTKLFLPIIF